MIITLKKEIHIDTNEVISNAVARMRENEDFCDNIYDVLEDILYENDFNHSTQDVLKLTTEIENIMVSKMEEIFKKGE